MGIRFRRMRGWRRGRRRRRRGMRLVGRRCSSGIHHSSRDFHEKLGGKLEFLFIQCTRVNQGFNRNSR
jgi:hypothetical protein